VVENIRRYLLKEYLMKETKRAGFGGLDIQRTPMGTRVTLTIERPGLVIGRKGSSIKFLETSVEKNFNFDNPKIEVQEVHNPNLNAQIMAEKLASALERGWHFRRAGHSTVRRIMEAGAKGCQIVISGKLTGQRHRVEKFKEGHIKFCGEPAIEWMEEGFAVAKKKLGIIGVKVQIMDPEAKLPDEIEIAVIKEPEAEEEPEDKPKEKPEEKSKEKPKEKPQKKELKDKSKEKPKEKSIEKTKEKPEIKELKEKPEEKSAGKEKKEQVETKPEEKTAIEKKSQADTAKLGKKPKKEKPKQKLPEKEQAEPGSETKKEEMPKAVKEEGEKENKEEVKSNEPDQK
jgi:small subunit ribosomal protein S3